MRYFAFEGVDTLGKSTQIEILKLDFFNKPEREYYKKFIFVKEPGFTEVGSKIRDIILNEKLSKKAELFLFLADRAELFSKIDFKNEFIISDRSLLSHLAYAIDDDFDELLKFNLYATNNILPNFVIFFKGDYDLINSRLGNKNLDEIEKRGIKYFLKIQENYEKIFKKLNLNVLEINANDSILNINKKIKEYINDLCD